MKKLSLIFVIFSVGSMISCNLAEKSPNEKNDKNNDFNYISGSNVPKNGETVTESQNPQPTPQRTPSVLEQTFDKIQTNTADANAIVRYIPDNNDAWYARWNIIENAKKSLDITYFSIAEDVFGYSFLGLLKKKAEEGVTVRVMLDSRGSLKLAHAFLGMDYLQELAQHKNIQVKIYNRFRENLVEEFEDIRNIMASNHDKLLIGDNQYLITGGRNIAEPYFTDPQDDPKGWRDSDIFVNSKIVAEQATKIFDEGWSNETNFQVRKDIVNIQSRKEKIELAYTMMNAHIRGKDLSEIDKKKYSITGRSTVDQFLKELVIQKRKTNYSTFDLSKDNFTATLRLVGKDSMKDFKNDITDVIFSLFDAAEKVIYIQNPYVVLTPKAQDAIKRANERGVRVLIHTNSPTSSDNAFTQAFFIADWKSILKNNNKVEIYATDTQRNIHSKCFVIDDTVSIVGTYNMDFMSEQINAEDLTIAKSIPFSTSIRSKIEEDIRSSYRYEIMVLPDGTVKTVFGPESHVDPAILDFLNLLNKFNIVRPLI